MCKLLSSSVLMFLDTISLKYSSSLHCRVTEVNLQCVILCNNSTVPVLSQIKLLPVD